MFVLRLNCDDKPGIVAAVAVALSEAGCNIEESSQFNDHFSGQFFMRVVFRPLLVGGEENFKSKFINTAKKLGISWQVSPLEEKIKTLILVSKADHCLNDLLYRWRTNHLSISITGILSNHETLHTLAVERDLPFHYLPVSMKTKKKQEKSIVKIIEETGSELIILARYMQILSDEICNKYKGRIINIHHSFLPGFKGARPYQQAYERGVKIIGATAHFATADLDEGPIIEQETVRVDHAHTPQKMQAIGRDTEARVLARAVKLYTERRIFLHGKRTIIL